MENKSFNFNTDVRYQRHNKLIQSMLPYKSSNGYYALHSFVVPETSIPEKQLRDTFLNPSLTYTEALTHSLPHDTHPDGYSRRYQTKDASGNLVNSQITTCYFDGHIVTDGYIDIFCEGDDGFNPNWFFYKIQRHLQLSKEILEGTANQFFLALIFQHLEHFKWEIYQYHHISQKIPYAGYHHDIVLQVMTSEIHGRDKWNVKMDIVERLMTQVARIFGMDKLPQAYWTQTQELDYPHGIAGR